MLKWYATDQHRTKHFHFDPFYVYLSRLRQRSMPCSLCKRVSSSQQTSLWRPRAVSPENRSQPLPEKSHGAVTMPSLTKWLCPWSKPPNRHGFIRNMNGKMNDDKPWYTMIYHQWGGSPQFSPNRSVWQRLSKVDWGAPPSNASMHMGVKLAPCGLHHRELVCAI